jgi:hypothetical protein
VPPDGAAQFTIGSELQWYTDDERADRGAGEYLVTGGEASVS